MKKNIAELYNENIIVFKSLVKKINAHIKNGDVVIDLGCGTGAYIKFLAERIGKNGKLIGIDKNSAMVKYCKKKFNSNNIFIKKLDVEKLSSLKEKVDVIFSSLTLHFTNVAKSLKEIKKSIKKNGKLIFLVPLYRSGIEIVDNEKSNKFKQEFLKNLNAELKRYNINKKPSLDYANNREKLFKTLLQKNRFKILSWKVDSTEKANEKILLNYFKISWRSKKLLPIEFSIRYKILTSALKNTFKKYPNFTSNRYYLMTVAKND